jgi:hypothetical protein
MRNLPRLSPASPSPKITGRSFNSSHQPKLQFPASPKKEKKIEGIEKKNERIMTYRLSRKIVK